MKIPENRSRRPRAANKALLGLAVILFASCMLGRGPAGVIVENRAGVPVSVDVDYPQCSAQH